MKRSTQSGNTFFALFGAIAFTGIVTISLSMLIKGPLALSVDISRKAMGENEMVIATQGAIMAAASQPSNGDCDGDLYVEPIEWRAAGVLPAPTGGGLIPLSVPGSKKDQWGTDYGYCVWNHGPMVAGEGSCGGGGQRRLQGANLRGYPVIAMISAGPDKTFTTTCRSFADADVNDDGDLLDATDLPLISKAAETDDDVIFANTYDEAATASGGLWSIKSTDPNTAVINKDIEVSGDANFTDLVKATVLSSGDTGDTIAAMDGVKLPDAATYNPACDSTHTGVMRTNAGILEMCDGTDWIEVTGGGGETSDILGDQEAHPTCSSSEYGLMRYERGPTVRQKTNQVINNDPSDAVSFTDTPLEGSAIIVTISMYDEGGTMNFPQGSVTDNEGNLYQLVATGPDIGPMVNPGLKATSYIFATYNIDEPAGPITVMIAPATPSASFVLYKIGALEVTGIASSAAFDVSGTVTNTNQTTTTVSTSAPTTSAYEFGVAIHNMLANDDNTHYDPAAGWEEQFGNMDANNSAGWSVVTSVLGGAGVAAHTWIHDNDWGNTNGALIATFKPGNNGGMQMQICDGSSWVDIGEPATDGSTPSVSLATNIDALDDAAADTAAHNVFLGENAGAAITSGTNNTAIGEGALRAVTTGSDNVAIGYDAGGAITTGSGNIAIGGNGYIKGEVGLRVEDETVDLTALNAVDWLKPRIWCSREVRKATGGELIGPITDLAGTLPVDSDNNGCYESTGTLHEYYLSQYLFSWSDGYSWEQEGEDGSGWGSDSTVGSGVRITFPADTTTRSIRVYYDSFGEGTGGAAIKIRAYLADGSAPEFIDTTFTVEEDTSYGRILNLTYRAATPTTLTVDAILTYAGGGYTTVAITGAILMSVGDPPQEGTTELTPTANQQLSIGGSVYADMANDRVGVGVRNPQVRLHASGEGLIGNTSVGCSGGLNGVLRYNTTLQVFQVCDGTSSTWVTSAPYCSTTPDDFTFSDTLGVGIGERIYSKMIYISGVTCLNASVSIAGTGGPQYRICRWQDWCNGDGLVQDWTSAAGTIQAGQYLQLRLTAANAISTTRTATVTVGGQARAWNVVTEGAVGAYKRVFVTSTTSRGSMGGAAGPDAICAARATAAGLAGTYKAWTATTTANDPESAFVRAAVPYRQTNGALVAQNWNDLVDGNLINGIEYDEFGVSQYQNATVWTNVRADGTRFGGTANTHFCATWGSNASNRYGHWGWYVGDATDGSWTDASWAQTTVPCNEYRRLYCFEQ